MDGCVAKCAGEPILVQQRGPVAYAGDAPATGVHEDLHAGTDRLLPAAPARWMWVRSGGPQPLVPGSPAGSLVAESVAFRGCPGRPAPVVRSPRGVAEARMVRPDVGLPSPRIAVRGRERVWRQLVRDTDNNEARFTTGPEDTQGRLNHPARLTQPRRSALRING